MPSKVIRSLSLILGALIGYLAWPSAIYLAPLVWFLCIFIADDLYAPFLAMLGYHLATSESLTTGANLFFPHAGLILGILFWIGSSLVFAVPYLLYRPISRGLTFTFHFLDEPFPISVFGSVLALLITSTLSSVIPPLGLIGWTSPWLGTFYYNFVGPSYTGPIVFVLTYALVSLIQSQALEEGQFTGFGLVLIIGTMLSGWSLSHVPLPRFQSPLDAIRPLNTHAGELSDLAFIMEGRKLVPEVQSMMYDHTITLLPENIAGPWLPGTKSVWQPVIDQSTGGAFALVGAAVPVGVHYADALIAMGYHTAKILPDRIPVPFSMWHPWHPQGSFTMHVFGPPEVFTAGGVKFGYLICYEQILIWPALSLIGQHIQVLLAPANMWWTRGTTISADQHASARAWAHFFDVPLVRAVNT